jgi:hypothetical protein
VFRACLLGFSAGAGKFKARPVSRRLFSTFAHGWPGVGLLLTRPVVGIASVVRRIIELQSAPPLISLVVIHVLAIAAGILRLAGLWAPFAGVLLAIFEIWSASRIPMIRGAISCGEPSVRPWPCSDRAPGPSMPAFLDGSASILQTERVRALTSLVLVLKHFKRVLPRPIWCLRRLHLGLWADGASSTMRN